MKDRVIRASIIFLGMLLLMDYVYCITYKAEEAEANKGSKSELIETSYVKNTGQILVEREYVVADNHILIIQNTTDNALAVNVTSKNLDTEDYYNIYLVLEGNHRTAVYHQFDGDIGDFQNKIKVHKTNNPNPGIDGLEYKILQGVHSEFEVCNTSNFPIKGCVNACVLVFTPMTDEIIGFIPITMGSYDFMFQPYDRLSTRIPSVGMNTEYYVFAYLSSE